MWLAVGRAWAHSLDDHRGGGGVNRLSSAWKVSLLAAGVAVLAACSAADPGPVHSAGNRSAQTTTASTTDDSVQAGLAGTPARMCFGRAVTITARPGEVSLGTTGPDVIWGTTGSDEINASGGRDRVCSRGGADVVRGGPGSDQIDGGWGNDALRGGEDYDGVNGGPGPDIVHGGKGLDGLSGGPGTDRIRGGPGYHDQADLTGDGDRVSGVELVSYATAARGVTVDLALHMGGLTGHKKHDHFRAGLP
jgi:Ca2+-binding RTX toxin-like protein